MIALLAACGAADETLGPACGPNDPCAAGTTCDAELGQCVRDDATPASTILASAVAAESLMVDRVAGADGAIRTDGRNDGAFEVTVNGPLVSLSLLVVNDEGRSSGNQIWDTTVGESPIHRELGVTFVRGASTWQVGVFEDGVLQNRPDGSLPALEGRHELRLYASNSGYFRPGVKLRWVLQRPDGTLAGGPVFAYPE
jgi:hypothetical protein